MQDIPSALLPAVQAVLCGSIIAAAAGWAPAPVRAPGAQAPAPADVAVPATPVVQLRSFPWSPDVYVVAWEAEDSGWGLRSTIRHDGSLVRDHTIYVSTLYHPGVSRVRKAVLDGNLLLMQGVGRDRLACWDDVCTPSSYFVARIREDRLRASRDDLSVYFLGDEDRQFTLHIAPEVVDAYLQAVDSVRAARRSNGA
jgi:hypothetical protein